MSNQIDDEYQRILRYYRNELSHATRVIEAEIEAIDEASANHYRFRLRHAMIDLATTILQVDAKMSVFSNFSWDPNR